MMMKLVKWFLWTALLALAALLFGCIDGKPQPAAPSAEPGDASKPQPADPKDKFKGKTLSLLVWEGYADPEFTKGFEDKYGVTIKATYFGSSDELVAELRGRGSVYDVVSPSSDVARLLVQLNLVAPIDTAKISSYKDLAPALRDLAEVEKDGKPYGVPFTWAPNYLIYDSEVIKEEPKSWTIFFDPQYKGKISLWDDITNIFLIGQVLGLDKTDRAALYNMTDEQLAQVKKKLIELKPQVRKYWAIATELNDLFKNKEIVLAMGWPLTPAMLNKEGRKFKAVIPAEGATGWIDWLMISAGSQNKELAELYLDYVTQPKTMAIVAEVTNYNVPNAEAGEHMSEELKNAYMAGADVYLKRINFWRYIKNRKKYNELWSEVKSSK